MIKGDSLQANALGEQSLHTVVLDEKTLQTAALWSIRLRDGQDCHAALAQWRAAHLAHEMAWCKICQLETRLTGLNAAPPAALRQALNATGLSRRQLIGTLAGLTAVAPAAWLAWPQWLHWRSDFHTAKGEIRQFILPDGSELLLNSDSALDVQYSENQRQLLLRSGEAMVRTVADPRPLSLSTPQGRFVALGTHFSVRLNEQSSQLALTSGQVAIENRHGQRLRIAQPGEVWQLDGEQVQPPASNGIDPTAWQQRRLVLDNARLDAVLAELSRQRSGWLRCDHAAGALKISGVFVLGDSNQLLATLASALPIKLRYRSDYWVQVELK